MSIACLVRRLKIDHDLIKNDPPISQTIVSQEPVLKALADQYPLLKLNGESSQHVQQVSVPEVQRDRRND